MYFINILDKSTDKIWCEYYDSYYIFKKRVNKLKYSKKLITISRSQIID